MDEDFMLKHAVEMLQGIVGQLKTLVNNRRVPITIPRFAMYDKDLAGKLLLETAYRVANGALEPGATCAISSVAGINVQFSITSAKMAE